MKKIILYGAGKRGTKVARLLGKHGIDIAGFCDSKKIGKIVFDNQGKSYEKNIFELDDIDASEYTIIITIADYNEAIKVRDQLCQRNIEIATMEQILFAKHNIIKGNREYIAEFHIDEMDDYFNKAELSENLEIFWGGGFLKECLIS